MTTDGFAAVAQTLRAALEEWFAARPGRVDAESARGTIVTNSMALEERARPVSTMLARRGIDLRERASVLDLGCGFGALSVYLAWHGARVVGIDPNRSRFVVGESAARVHGLDVELREGRMETLAIPDETFDAAVMNNTFCYLLAPQDRQAALAGATRALCPGGVLVLVEPTRLPIDPFTRLPLLPYLPPDVAAGVAARVGARRPRVRLTSPRALRGELAAAGLADVRLERRGLAAVLGRYAWLTALRPH